MQAGTIVFEGPTAKGLNVVLRYPQPGDAPVLLDYINTLSSEQTYILFQGEQLTLEDEERWLENHLDQIASSRLVQLMAFSNGQLAGDAEIALGSGTSRHVAGLGISLAQPFRGQGLGELLISTLIEEAAINLPGLRMITLNVFGNNVVAQNLYRKVGFVEYGRLPGGILHRGEYVDNVYMYRRVRDE